jgi:hypothetical protein
MPLIDVTDDELELLRDALRFRADYDDSYWPFDTHDCVDFGEEREDVHCPECKRLFAIACTLSKKLAVELEGLPSDVEDYARARN